MAIYPRVQEWEIKVGRSFPTSSSERGRHATRVRKRKRKGSLDDGPTSVPPGVRHRIPRWRAPTAENICSGSHPLVGLSSPGASALHPT